MNGSVTENLRSYIITFIVLRVGASVALPNKHICTKIAYTGKINDRLRVVLIQGEGEVSGIRSGRQLTTKYEQRLK